MPRGSWIGYRGTPEERFWKHVQKHPDGCWLWTGGRAGGRYGAFHVDGHQVKAHRWAYEHFIGPVSSGLVLDHLCRVTRCVNPAHLESVTDRVNIMRGVGEAPRNAAKTHCIHGHSLSGSNLYIQARTGKRSCVLCRRLSKQHLDTPADWAEAERRLRALSEVPQ